MNEPSSIKPVGSAGWNYPELPEGAAQARRLLDTVVLYQAMGGGSPFDAEALVAN